MAVTALLLRATTYRLFFAIGHDGAVGDTLTITNAELLAAAAAQSKLQALFNTPVDNDAEAVLLMAAGGKAVTAILNGVAGAGWAMDWEEDGSNRVQLVVEGETGIANEGILQVQLLHSYNK